MFSYPAQTTTQIRTKVGGGVQDGKWDRFDPDLFIGGAIAINNKKQIDSYAEITLKMLPNLVERCFLGRGRHPEILTTMNP